MEELLREIERRLVKEAQERYPEPYMGAERVAFITGKRREIAQYLVDRVVRPD